MLLPQANQINQASYGDEYGAYGNQKRLLSAKLFSPKFREFS
jgi:hypothetical protein